ncbi:MAG UNVERIFIED_CONTAM: hypothetical protein LVT10_06135 [Anaerolineae bacterium]
MKPIHRQHGLACLVMVIGVGAWLFPMLGVFSAQFIGDPFGDAYEYAHHIWWIHHALTHAQNPFHVETLAYPNGLGRVVVGESRLILPLLGCSCMRCPCPQRTTSRLCFTWR